MQPTSDNQDPRAEEKKEEPSGKTLLAIFERPPEVPGENINPAVIIAIEKRSAYPELKSASEYFGPLSDVAERRGLKLTDEPYSFPINGRPLIRGDFGSTGNAHIRQTSLVWLRKSYILSFTFLGGSDDEIESLIENLTFTARTTTGSPK